MKTAAAVFLALLAAVSVSSAADDADLPPPEQTEYWTPVPPVVHVPAGGVPSDAVVLFDGTSLDAWEPEKPDGQLWKIEDGAMVIVPREKSSGLRTKQAFGDVQLHVEFRTPVAVDGEGQGRGNSGIFLMGQYEVQVLDSWQNPTYVNGQLGSIYKQHPPLVNPARPPGEWQTFDIVFIAPRFAADGTVEKPARFTVFLNGVLVQHDVVVRGGTRWRGQPKYTPHRAKEPLLLQDHGDAVAFRNIWVREITLPEEREKGSE